MIYGNHSQYSQKPFRDLNPVRSEYKSTALTLHQNTQSKTDNSSRFGQYSNVNRREDHNAHQFSTATFVMEFLAV